MALPPPQAQPEHGEGIGLAESFNQKQMTGGASGVITKTESKVCSDTG
jgi:hypothetical protein